MAISLAERKYLEGKKIEKKEESEKTSKKKFKRKGHHKNIF
jgi:hypothetical protein